MQRVQRKFGTFLKRSEDQQDVGDVLHEFAATEKFLNTFIAHTEAFRGAWSNIMRTQLSVAEVYHLLYQPIGTDENVQHMSAATPEQTLIQASQFASVYAQLNTEITEDVVSIDTRLVRPAMQARDDLKPMKKIIKKREDRKLDYERYHGRVETAKRKDHRSEKEEAALAKHETDLAVASQEYSSADEHLLRALPPLIDAVARLLPHLLAAQVMIQHSLVAQVYTAVYEYCQQQRLPVPAPEFDQVVPVWNAAFTPLRTELEGGISLIANGKAIHKSMDFEDKTQGSLTGLGLRNQYADKTKNYQGDTQGSVTGFGLRNQFAEKTKNHQGLSKPSFLSRRESGQEAHGGADEELAPTRPPRPGMAASSPAYDDEEAPPTKPPRPGSGRTTPGTPFDVAHRPAASPYRTSQGSSYSPSKVGSGADYFSRPRIPSTSSPGSNATSAAAAAAAKKKPPPPVPAKRIPSSQGQFVTALYDFTGQNEGDLSFREGEKIRVVKKTESTNDWWKGEVRGVTGSFPANYVQV